MVDHLSQVMEVAARCRLEQGSQLRHVLVEQWRAVCQFFAYLVEALTMRSEMEFAVSGLLVSQQLRCGPLHFLYTPASDSVGFILEIS